MNKNLLHQLEQELLSVKNQLNNNKFLVSSKDGSYVEIKQYSIADVGVEGTYYVHKTINEESYTVSEATSGFMIAQGDNVGIAVGKARGKLQKYVSDNGIDALHRIIEQARANMPIQEVVKEHKPEPTAEPIVVKQEEKPTTIEQALTNSIDYRNKIDLEYISELLTIPVEEIEEYINEHKLAFTNPESNELQPDEQYLSGNVREKLVIAEFASQNNPKYERNVEALKKIIPETIPSALIQYSIGAAWIPLKVFEKFAHGMFKCNVYVVYMKSTGKFSATIRIPQTPQIKSTYEAGGKNGLEIFNATLNNQQLIISETINGKSTKNIEKTSAAQSMQEQMQDEFTAFIRADEDIQAETEKIYNEIFNSHVDRKYATPQIDYYPGASTHKKLRRHQKLGVQRAMNESTLFAHSVGAGKSLLIITTAMELRRLGKANKVMIVVQNKTRGQFLEEFRSQYPNANILAPTAEDLTPIRKPYFYERIANEDFDAIIIQQSQFDLIPDEIERQMDMLETQVELATDTMQRISRITSPFEWAQAKRMVRMAENELRDLREEREKRHYTEREASKQDGYKRLLTFEQMNIDALLIDEFERYKRLGLNTSLSQIKGIDPAKSARSQSCFLKMRWVQQNNGGRNTFTYTGTPITNTMAEVWTQIRYVRPDILVELGIEHFDQFAKTFGQIVPSLEMTGGGTFKIQNRFAKFQNLPELVGAFRKCADIVQKEDIQEFINTNDIPKMFNGKIDQVVVERSPELVEQIQEFRDLLEYYDQLEGMEKRMKSWIPLVVFNRAKQAAIDLRLLDSTKKDSPNSKVNIAIRRAFAIYKETGRVQMMFCDLYQSPEPKSEWLDEDCTIPNPAYGVPRFNLFNEIKSKLVELGVKPQEIAILTEPKYDKVERLSQLFEDANSGKIKFLLGTTERMGVGVNAQRLLFALHMLDAPQRPRDFAQRRGRIERQGNLNEYFWLICYGTEKTLDSAAFQRLAIKQRFIDQIMKGENLERVMDDAGDDALVTFEEMMALLSDSPFAQQKLLVNNKLKSERLKRDNFYAKQVQVQRNLNYANEKIERLQLDYHNQTRHLEVVQQNFPEKKVTVMVASGIEHTEELSLRADEYIDGLMKLQHESPTGSASGFIMANGIKVVLKINENERWSSKHKMMYKHPSLYYTIPEIGIHENIHGNGVNVESNSGTGLMHSIRWKISDAYDKPETTLSDIRYQQNIVAELEKGMENVFDESKLNVLEAEVEILTQKMLEERLKPEIEQEILGI